MFIAASKITHMVEVPSTPQLVSAQLYVHKMLRFHCCYNIAPFTKTNKRLPREGKSSK